MMLSLSNAAGLLHLSGNNLIESVKTMKARPIHWRKSQLLVKSGFVYANFCDLASKDSVKGVQQVPGHCNNLLTSLFS